MFYGNTPVNSMKVKHYEISTNDCDMIASDLQAGKTAVARGKKITGTGKCFEFANYGDFETNTRRYVPSMINIIEIASKEHPIKLSMTLNDMEGLDFSNKQNIGSVIIGNVDYPIYAQVISNILTISCEQSFCLQIFYGKDNYV